MKTLTMPQGSPEWHEARLGIPTASCFDKVVTPGGKLSKSSHKYMCALLAERLLGVPVDDGAFEYMERGRAFESQAIAYYELERRSSVQRVGFCLEDRGRCGASPDGLIGEDGGLEMKSPSAAVHVSYMLGGTSEEYKPQIQGGLWITGRRWWDVLSYHPQLEPVLVRVERDEPYIAALGEAVYAFCDRLDAAWAQLNQEVAA